MKTVTVRSNIAFTVPSQYITEHLDSIAIHMEGVGVMAVIPKEMTLEVETPFRGKPRKVALGAEITFYMDDNVSTMDWYRIANAVEKDFKIEGGLQIGLRHLMEELQRLQE